MDVKPEGAGHVHHVVQMLREVAARAMYMWCTTEKVEYGSVYSARRDSTSGSQISSVLQMWLFFFNLVWSDAV